MIPSWKNLETHWAFQGSKAVRVRLSAGVRLKKCAFIFDVARQLNFENEKKWSCLTKFPKTLRNKNEFSVSTWKRKELSERKNNDKKWKSYFSFFANFFHSANLVRRESSFFPFCKSVPTWKLIFCIWYIGRSSEIIVFDFLNLGKCSFVFSYSVSVLTIWSNDANNHFSKW